MGKYEITPYIQDVINKLIEGGSIVYKVDDSPSPSSTLVFNNENESITNWVLTVLWDEGIVVASGDYPVFTYTYKH